MAAQQPADSRDETPAEEADPEGLLQGDLLGDLIEVETLSIFHLLRQSCPLLIDEHTLSSKSKKRESSFVELAPIPIVFVSQV